MTQYAKLLILANLGLSLMFVAWAFGLYSERSPWMSFRAADGSQIVGQVDQLNARIAALNTARAAADARWLTATREVLARIAELPARRTYCAEQIKIATTGTDAAGQPVTPPVQQLSFLANGLVEQKKVGRPAVQFDGKPALPLAGFKAAIEKQIAEILDTRQKITKVIQDTAALTELINGTKTPADAVTGAEKGLRGQLREAQNLVRDQQAEVVFLQSPLTNYTVELELLRRRQLALESRLKELTAAAFAGP